MYGEKLENFIQINIPVVGRNHFPSFFPIPVRKIISTQEIYSDSLFVRIFYKNIDRTLLVLFVIHCFDFKKSRIESLNYIFLITCLFKKKGYFHSVNIYTIACFFTGKNWIFGIIDCIYCLINDQLLALLDLNSYEPN